MKKQKRMLALAIFIAFISLVVLLPRIVNADESVYEVIEFVGISSSSFEEATINAVNAAVKYLNEKTTEQLNDYKESDAGFVKIKHLEKYIMYRNDETLALRSRVRIRKRITHLGAE